VWLLRRTQRGTFFTAHSGFRAGRIGWMEGHLSGSHSLQQQNAGLSHAEGRAHQSLCEAPRARHAGIVRLRHSYDSCGAFVTI